MLTIVELSDVSGRPLVKLDLPLLQVGAKIDLRFKLDRKNKGRTEILEVVGVYRIASVTTQLGRSFTQYLAVESMGAVPSWKAVKAKPPIVRRLGPTKGPRTPIEG